MSLEIIDTTAGAGDTGKQGGDKLNRMFAELYGASAPDAVLARLKLSATATMTTARRTMSQPWNSSKAWAAGTFVNGQRCTNAGNVYVCSLPGTSTVAPTGTAAGPITEGTTGAATFYYAGPAFTSLANAPTYTTSKTTPTLGRFYTRGGASAPTDPAPPVTIANNGWYEYWGAIKPDTSVVGNILGDTFLQGAAGAFAFETDALTISIGQVNASGYSALYEIDGRYLVDGTVAQVDTSGITWTTITFPDRRPRKVTARSRSDSTGVVFVGVYCDENGSIWAPAKFPGDLSGFFVADSYGVGGQSYNADFIDRGIAGNFFSELGIDKYYNDASGGSGFISGDAYTGTGRLDRIAIMKPDVIGVLLSVNDVQSQTDIVTAVNTWYAGVKSRAPNAIIIAVGNMGKGVSPQETYAADALKAKNDPKFFYVPGLGQLMTGNGNVSAPSSPPGNSAIYVSPDNSHPTARGHAYLGQRTGIAARNLILPR